MRTYLIRATLALAVALVVSTPAAAQSRIAGTVVDAEGQPVEGATVTIQAIEGIRSAELTTDEDGEFSQIGLPGGDYVVRVEMGDLRQAQQVNIRTGATEELDFQLTPTSGLTPEQLKANEEMQTIAAGAADAMREGRNAEAIQMFNDILLEVPTCSDCVYNIGVAYSNLEQYAEAEASFMRSIEMAPDSGQAYTGLANLYNVQQKYDLAQQASTKAAELTAAGGGGNNAEALYNQGVILWNAGSFAEAKEQFELSIAADPSMAMAYYQLGMANLNLGQVPEARQAFEGYLEVDPDGEKAAEVEVFVQQLPQ